MICKTILFLFYQNFFCTEALRIDENLCDEAQILNVFEEVYGNIVKQNTFQDLNNLNTFFDEPILAEENDRSDYNLLDLDSTLATLGSSKTVVADNHNDSSPSYVFLNNLAYNDQNITIPFIESEGVLSYHNNEFYTYSFFTDIEPELTLQNESICEINMIDSQDTHIFGSNSAHELLKNKSNLDVTSITKDDQDPGSLLSNKKDCKHSKTIVNSLVPKSSSLLTTSTNGSTEFDSKVSRKRVCKDQDEALRSYKKNVRYLKKKKTDILSNATKNDEDVDLHIEKQPMQDKFTKSKRKDSRNECIKISLHFTQIKIIKNIDFKGTHKPAFTENMSFNTMNYYDILQDDGRKMHVNKNYTYFKKKFHTDFWLVRFDLNREVIKDSNVNSKQNECCEVIQSSRIYSAFLYVKKPLKSTSSEFNLQTSPFFMGRINADTEIVQRNYKSYYQYKVYEMEKIVANMDKMKLLKIQTLSFYDMPRSEFASITNRKFDEKTRKTVFTISYDSSKSIVKSETHPYAFLSYFMLNTPEFTAHEELFNINYSSKKKYLTDFFDNNFSHRITFSDVKEHKDLILKIEETNEIRNDQLSSYLILNKNKLLEVQEISFLEIDNTSLITSYSDFSELNNIKIYQKFLELKNLIESYIFEKKLYDAQNIDECMNNLFLFIPEMLFYIQLKQTQSSSKSSDVSKAMKYQSKENQLVEIILKDYKIYCETSEESNDLLVNLRKSIFNFRKHINHDKNITLCKGQKCLYDFAFVLKYNSNGVKDIISTTKVSFLLFILAFTNENPDLYCGFKNVFIRRYKLHTWKVQVYIKVLRDYPEISRGFALTLQLVLDYLKINIETTNDITSRTPIIFPLAFSNLIVSECHHCEKMIWTHSHSSDVYKFFFDQFLELLT